MDKTLPDLASAVAGIEDGMTVMIGGFGGSGAPIELIHALIDRFLATGHPREPDGCQQQRRQRPCRPGRADRDRDGAPG
jgi:acyl CoA:acetate/3-ketoacid CoA transferase